MIAQGWDYRPCSCMGVFETFMQGAMSTTNALYADIILFVLALIAYLYATGGFFDRRPLFLKRRNRPLPEAEPAKTESRADYL